MYKFFGIPNKEVKNPLGKIVFRFDSKGEFICDDNGIIERAKPYFDHIELKAEIVGKRINNSVKIPPVTITKADEADKCKHCGGTHENKGQVLACAKKHKKEA